MTGSCLLALPLFLLTSVYSRLARRGGIKRISRMIYDDVRQALKERLERVRSFYKEPMFVC
jgi:histone H3/H4